jgi:hypothetical protein
LNLSKKLPNFIGNFLLYVAIQIETRKYIILIANLIIVFTASSQDFDNLVNWSFYYQELDKLKYKITIDATIQENWKFADDQMNEKLNGPIELEIRFEPNGNIEFIDSINEISPKLIYDKFFEENIYVYSNRFVRSYFIKVTDNNEPVVLSGSINNMLFEEKVALMNFTCFKYKFNDLEVKSITIGNDCIIATKR